MSTETLKRPDYRHPRVIELAAAKIAPDVIKWAEESDGELPQREKDRVLQDMVKLLKFRGYELDGYKLAKAMESMSLVGEADSSLVEVLDSAHWHMSDAIDQITREWVVENNITPTFKVGDKVVYIRQGDISANEMREVEGTVMNINPERAKYTVNCPALGHRPTFMQGKRIPGTYGEVVNFEHVRALTLEESNPSV